MGSTSITRRQFLEGSLMAMAASGRALAEPKAVQPDILFLMPDQMRGDCLSVLGHPVVRTPNMDQLARGGVLFRRAYSAVASCIPARYALLTGLFPQTSGVVGFRAKPITTATMPQLLSKAGYTTALVGRNMHQHGGGKALGYHIDIPGSTYVNNDVYDREFRAAHPETGGIKEFIGKLGATYNHWQAAPWPLGNKWHPTTWTVTKSRGVVAKAPPGKPLFLTTSFYAPHPPLVPTPKYYEHYYGAKLPRPARGDWVDWKTITPKGRDGGHRVLLQGETLRKAQAGYFGLIEHLDTEIAPLIAEFKARSEKAGRPWCIAFSSDHGEMLGDHAYFRKCEPLEGSANIPFIIAGSRELGFRPGTRSNEPVALEDLLPTFVELAGGPAPNVDGISLVPVLRGRTEEVRAWYHFEHSPCYSREQAFHALADGRFKYIWRPASGKELLFDLEKDPHEERNLAKDPSSKALLEKWRGILIERLKPRPEGFTDGAELIPGRPYKAINPGVPRGPASRDHLHPSGLSRPSEATRRDEGKLRLRAGRGRAYLGRTSRPDQRER